MKEQPSFSSQVTTLPPDHSFRQIFEQVKTNLAHVGISPDGDSDDWWTTFFEVPHKLDNYKWEISVVNNPHPKNKPPYLGISFEQGAVWHNIEYSLSLIPDHFKLRYVIQYGMKNHWTDFSGTTIWYKNGAVKEQNIKKTELRSDSSENDVWVDEPDAMTELIEIVEDHERLFRIATRD